jgi:hypothetical protein
MPSPDRWLPDNVRDLLLAADPRDGGHGPEHRGPGSCRFAVAEFHSSSAWQSNPSSSRLLGAYSETMPVAPFGPTLATCLAMTASSALGFDGSVICGQRCGVSVVLAQGRGTAAEEAQRRVHDQLFALEVRGLAAVEGFPVLVSTGWAARSRTRRTWCRTTAAGSGRVRCSGTRLDFMGHDPKPVLR